MAELKKSEIAAHSGALAQAMSELKQNVSPEIPDQEELLGLAYRRGEEVIDVATGKRGKIIAGTRASFAIPVSREEGH